MPIVLSANLNATAIMISDKASATALGKVPLEAVALSDSVGALPALHKESS